MKVMVGINDFNEACIKDKDFNGYVIVEAEPIECQPKSQPEWVENFYRLSDDNKMLVSITSNSLLNGHKMIIEFFKQTLKEFAKDYGYMGWNVIKKKYGIED